MKNMIFDNIMIKELQGENSEIKYKVDTALSKIDNFELQNNDELKVILSKIIKTYKIDGDNNANT